MFYKKLIPICLISLIPTIALSNPQSELDRELAGDDLIFIQNEKLNDLTTVLRISRDFIQQEICSCKFDSYEKVFKCKSCSILPKNIVNQEGEYGNKGYKKTIDNITPVSESYDHSQGMLKISIGKNSYIFRQRSNVKVHRYRKSGIPNCELKYQEIDKTFDYNIDRHVNTYDTSSVRSIKDYYEFKCGLDAIVNPSQRICPKAFLKVKGEYDDYIASQYKKYLEGEKNPNLIFWCNDDEKAIYPTMESRNKCEMSHKISLNGVHEKRIIRYIWSLKKPQREVCNKPISRKVLEKNHIPLGNYHTYIPFYCGGKRSQNLPNESIDTWSIVKTRYVTSDGQIYPPFIELYVMNKGKNALNRYREDFISLLENMYRKHMSVYEYTEKLEPHKFKIKVIDYLNGNTHIDQAHDLYKRKEDALGSLDHYYPHHKSLSVGLERTFFSSLDNKINTKTFVHPVILTDILPKRDVQDKLLKSLEDKSLTYVYIGKDLESEAKGNSTLLNILKNENFFDLSSKTIQPQAREEMLHKIILGIKPDIVVQEIP